MMHWAKQFDMRAQFPAQTVTTSEDKIARLKQAVARCDGQIASLKQSVARCDVQIVNLKQSVAQCEVQIVNLRKDVAVRNEQVQVHQERYEQLVRANRDQLEKILNSASWRITFPLRVAFDLALSTLQKIRGAFTGAPKIVKVKVSLGRPRIHDGVAATVIATQVPNVTVSDAAAIALARTGKFPSQAYLMAIAPVGLMPIALQQRAVLPKYSIVILQLNQAQLTINCINSILRNTPLEELEIVVVDNGSRPENIAALAAFKGCIKLLEVGVNRHFGEGNNLGVEYAKGERIILMNNDIVVTAGWLETLATELKEGVGAVGPCLLYPDELVQEAGGYMMADGSEERRYMHLHTDVLPVNPFECDYASAALLLMRRGDFFAIGGFDLYWEPAYYEDVDLCLRLRALGLKILCCPTARVFHVGNATSSDESLNLSLENIVSINKAKFANRWGPFLLGNAVDPAVQTLRPNPKLAVKTIRDETTYRNSRPHALICPPCEIKLDGEGRFILSIACALAQSYDVTLAFAHPYSGLRLKQLGAYFGLNVNMLKSSTLEKALSDVKTWEAAFVFGSAAGPLIPAPIKCSFYISDFALVQKSRRWQHPPLTAGYVCVCYGQFTFAASRGVQRRLPPKDPLNRSKQKAEHIRSAGHCRTLQYRKNYLILTKALTAILRR